MQHADEEQTSFAYHTETRFLKACFSGVGLFIFLTFTGAGWSGGRSLPQAFFDGLPVAASLTAILWGYGTFAMFHRSYIIDSAGVSLFKRGIVIRNIPWAEIRNVSGAYAHLVVRGVRGQRISFNIPPPIQKQARRVLAEIMKKHPK